MSHRYVQPQDFIGKTVKRVNCEAVNIIRFYFTDGTAIALEAETVTQAQIPAIVACEVCVKECEPEVLSKQPRKRPNLPRQGDYYVRKRDGVVRLVYWASKNFIMHKAVTGDSRNSSNNREYFIRAYRRATDEERKQNEALFSRP